MNFFQILWLLLSVFICAVMVFVLPVLQHHFGFVLDRSFVAVATVAVPVVSGISAYIFSKWRDSQLHHDR